MAPWLQYALPTIGAACETYLETTASYRQTVLTLCRRSVPEQQGLTTCLNGPNTPSLASSTVFRWLDRFSRGADAWWITLAAQAQQRSTSALRPPEPVEQLSAKGRSGGKRIALKQAWYLLWLLRWLLAFFGLTPQGWPTLLIHAGVKPRNLDHTGWFARLNPLDIHVPP